MGQTQGKGFALSDITNNKAAFGVESRTMAHSDNRQYELDAVTILFLILATITVSLRCYVRLRLLQIFKTEDFLAVFTFFCYALFSACVILSVQYGTGKRMDAVPPEDIPMAMMVCPLPNALPALHQNGPIC